MDAARQAALRVLCDVLDGGAYYNLALKKHLRALSEEEDRRFASALSALALERLITIDYYLKPFIRAKRVHGIIRNILRLGACQMLYMRVPDSAAVNESVRLAKDTGKAALAGFVNAVLRRFGSEHASVRLPDREKEPLPYLSAAYGFPLWLAERLAAQWGPDETEAFFAYRATFRTCVRMNALKTQAAAFEAALRDASVDFEKSALIEDAYLIKNMTDVENMALYREGALTVMGEASMLAVRAAVSMLRPDACVLDACSAPGSKAAYAAALFGNALHIEAWDVHAHRTELIRKNFKRLGVHPAQVLEKDASLRDKNFDGRFDLVMADVPCTGIGMIQRKPDIRHHRQPRDIAALAQTQRRILAACAEYVRRGGLLAYFTCTLLREENEDVVQNFLQEDGRFELRRPGLPAALGGLPDMATLKPHVNGTDGFFIALMERIS